MIRVDFLLLILFLFSINSYSQKSPVRNLGINELQGNQPGFITEVNERQVQLNASQYTQLNKLRGNSRYNSVRLVRIGSLPSIQRNGKLPVTIPGRRGALIASAKSVKSKSDIEFSWYGEFLKVNGSVFISSTEGRVYGLISVEGETYEIYDLGDHLSAFVHLDRSILDQGQCVMPESKKAIQPSSSSEENLKISTHLDVIRVLVLYTSNANNAVTNIGDIAIAGIRHFNTALVNSHITNADVELAGIEYLNFVETSDIKSDVERLSDSATAQNLRNQHQADVVVLLTHGPYGNINGRVSEIGPNETEAYAIVQVTDALPAYTFCHEIGHLFGARHQNDYSTDHPTYKEYAHGHKFITNLFWAHRTILYTLAKDPEKDNSRELYFSNPNVFYNKQPTGTSERNNARQIREQAPTVAAFSDFDPPLSVKISGPIYGNNSDTYTWTSTVSNGTSPYSYYWEYSTDGFNYKYFGTSSSVTALMPYNEDLHLRLTVTDSNNEQAVASYFTSNSDGDDCIKCYSKVSSYSDISIDFYPNPVYETVTLSYFTEIEDEIIQYEIYDNSGNLILSSSFTEKNSGSFSQEIDLKHLKKGTYFLKFYNGDNVTNHRFIVSER